MRYIIKKKTVIIKSQSKHDTRECYNVRLGDLVYSSISKSNIGHVRHVIWDAEYAKDYMRRHEKDNCNNTSHDFSQRSFIYMLCQERFR